MFHETKSTGIPYSVFMNDPKYAARVPDYSENGYFVSFMYVLPQFLNSYVEINARNEIVPQYFFKNTAFTANNLTEISIILHNYNYVCYILINDEVFFRSLYDFDNILVSVSIQAVETTQARKKEPSMVEKENFIKKILETHRPKHQKNSLPFRGARLFENIFSSGEISEENHVKKD